ncbi:hypothetical protein [Halapricum salinum]|uniref:Uncharacterized protein n=1 Tax=Halapricum salinum TaxID=1457250 RepID=A0A4D6HFA0_9EURY|nr:hypothetical protein [Halapricum salinum]QCC52643.1 hypothetical protein DV733_16015 [Halapricum salinum]
MGSSSLLNVGGSIVDRFRQPEYVGDNRCVPCTIVNGVLTVSLAVAIALGLLFGGSTLASAVGLGFVVVLVGSMAIYLRGYLIPYTPTLTKRYLPEPVLAWFEKTPSTPSDADEIELLDVEDSLQRLGVLSACPRVDDLCLEPSFGREWHARIETMDERQVDETTIASLLDVEDPDRLSLSTYGEAAVLRIDGHQAGQWESTAAIVADIAADRTLSGFHESWSSMHVLNRSRILNALRMFVEQCPACGQSVTVEQEAVESCCRTVDVAAVSCDVCGARVFEVELTSELQASL